MQAAQRADNYRWRGRSRWPYPKSDPKSLGHPNGAALSTGSSNRVTLSWGDPFQTFRLAGDKNVYVSMGCGVSKEEWREAVSIAARDAKEDALKKAELMLMQRRLH